MPTIVSAGDAEQMYMNTVVEVEGQPIILHNWADNGDMVGVNILTGASLTVPRDADLLMAPSQHQLGYLQISNEATFLQRRPVRQYRVGWCDRNVEGMNFSARDLVRTKAIMNAFRNMLNRDYPSLNRAYESAKSKECRLAFDRQFAIDYRGNILYKGGHVGAYDGKNIVLKNDRQYLSTQLENLKNV